MREPLSTSRSGPWAYRPPPDPDAQARTLLCVSVVIALLMGATAIWGGPGPRPAIWAELQARGYQPVEVRQRWTRGLTCGRRSGRSYAWRAVGAQGYTCGSPGYDSFRVVVVRGG
jgi:hypothetical protein